MRAIFAALALLACSSCKKDAGTVALVNDVAVRHEEDSGYRVIGVNGAKEVRLQSSYVTVVPLVVIEPGIHTISVRKEDTDSHTATFSAKFEAGKRYRIKEQSGVFSLIEENEK